ncbi:glutathione S-transferase family protein [Telmatospirillum siberiense]|uniref:Glutathione S-transferase family protein n=1 Tax=Telmatospirillum siberiense TaxID=382514 RepID=A0A2N3PYJ9_9PROT|nr:glutathione S-transferase family protein [Telmatospirillum siberiense]PKU25468.1 glutathione S-transferase family protein [Telmatospirillum siberiense]
MPDLTLYNYDLDESCYKARLLLSFLGLDCKIVAVDVFPGREQTTPPFLALNPLGRLPILTDGDFVLTGTEAILAHLARAHDPSERWLPMEGEAFARVMSWLTFSARDLDVTITARQRSLFGPPGDETSLVAASRRLLRIMDEHLLARGYTGEEWFAAPHPTIADIALFPAFALSRDVGIDHDEYPALRRWSRRFRGLSGFRVMPGIPEYF